MENLGGLLGSVAHGVMQGFGGPIGGISQGLLAHDRAQAMGQGVDPIQMMMGQVGMMPAALDMMGMQNRREIAEMNQQAQDARLQQSQNFQAAQNQANRDFQANMMNAQRQMAQAQAYASPAPALVTATDNAENAFRNTANAYAAADHLELQLNSPEGLSSIGATAAAQEQSIIDLATGMAAVLEPGKAITEDAVRTQLVAVGALPGKTGRWDKAKVLEWAKRGKAKMHTALNQQFQRVGSLPRNAYSDLAKQRMGAFYQANPQLDPTRIYDPTAVGAAPRGKAPAGGQQEDKFKFMPDSGGSPLQQMFPPLRGGTTPGGLVGGPAA